MDGSTNKVDVAAIGGRLRQVLDVLGVSQKAFSSRIGVSQAFTSAVVLGKSQPSIQMVGGMRLAYGVLPDWFILGRGEMFSALPAVADRVYVSTVDRDLHELLDAVLASGDGRVRGRIEGYLDGLVQSGASSRATARLGSA